MMKDLLNALLLGLSSGAGCLGVCAPFLVPFLISEHRKTAGNAKIVIEYLAGRLIAYIIVGAAAGLAGEYSGQFRISPKVYGALMIIAAVLMFFYSSGIIFEGFEKATAFFQSFKISRRLPLVAGLVSGINFCPPMVAAFSYTITLKSVAGSVLYFMVFFIATSLYFLPFIFSSMVTKFERVRNAGEIAGVLVSVWFLIYGVYLIVK
jgi:sulfite exporter TauE/SafE